ncbi:MAG: ISL3 family transposase, partial [Candidatus Microthrix sp.]|nr:ISL3 family transposase [Candidatus Microthrix sp.]
QRSDRTTVATALRVQWKSVTAIISRVVAEQLTDARFDGLTRLGVDEISHAKGHRFLTVVVDQTSGATLWVGEGKNAATLGTFYELLGPERCERIEAVSMDMAYAYPAATRKATNATICWDPFHVVMHLNKAVTATIRWSKLTKTGLPLSGDEARDLRWALLKKPSDHTDTQAAVLKRHQRSHHAIWRAQQLKERFRGLYQLDNPTHATAYLERWLASACRSQIRPMVKVSQLVRDHKEGIIASVELGLSNSRLEGTNSKIRLLNHRGYGHHSANTFIPIIYLACAGITTRLPWEPKPIVTSPRPTA